MVDLTTVQKAAKGVEWEGTRARMLGPEWSMTLTQGFSCGQTRPRLKGKGESL